jgi:uncharacterized membrane protein YcfT
MRISLGMRARNDQSGAAVPGRDTGRVAWIDAAKGISILLVVAHHAVSFLHTSGQAPAAVVAVNTALASLRMPLFFLASGFFMAGPLAAPWRTLLHKRVAFFLYLFVLWTLLRFALFHIPPLTVVGPYDSTNVEELVWSLLLPGSGMWFLYALALFAVLAKLARGVPVWLQVGAPAVLSALVGAEIVQFESGPWTRMARYLFFFLLGLHARQVIERLARSSTIVKVLAAAAASVGGAVGTVALDVRTVPGIALLLNLVAVTFGILFAAWITRWSVGRPLVALGGQTLPVYLIHIFWIAVIMVGVRHLALPLAAACALPVAMTVAATALSLLTHRLLVWIGAGWLFALPAGLAYRPPARQAA